MRDKLSFPHIENNNSNKATEVFLPSHIFRDRDISVLEAICEYMHESMGLTYHEIAVLLNRDDRTVWTCCNRARKKRKK